MQESKTLHYILGISLVMIAVFVVASLVMINSQAANVNTQLAVNNEAPTIFSSFIRPGADSPYTFGDGFPGGNITGFPGSGQNLVRVTGQLSDTNGWADIAQVDVTLRRSDKQAFAYPVAGCAVDSNDCYRGSSAGGSPLCTIVQDGTDPVRKKFDCQFLLDYWIDATDAGSAQSSTSWVVDVGVKDIGGLSNVVTGQNSKEIQSYVSVLYTGPIDFGTMAVNTNSGTGTNFDQVVTQGGNDLTNIQIQGTQMTCASGTVIPVGNISFKGAGADVAWAGVGTVPLSGSNQLAAINLGLKVAGDVQEKIFWNISVGNVSGPCTGTVTETAESA